MKTFSSSFQRLFTRLFETGEDTAQFLGRSVSLPDLGPGASIAGKTVLVTGAGGSIGSEVCRRLLAHEPAELVLLDMAETALYEVDLDLRETQTQTKIIPVIGDVRQENTRQQIFQRFDVHVVFHCAAYKHVPMMEHNPAEAILNNVVGTIEFANASREAGVDRFVMISTDKAVRPVSIMGATKRIAEIYVQNLARIADTRFITVRFGNVLGSNGSVVPLFQRQIRSGGPVTVTHPDIQRYFMTVEEAANLVIQAGSMGREAEIFLLDMGEPIRIQELAEHMIRAVGLIPHRDIKIEYIGLRPGERLTEELYLEAENAKPTQHPRIFVGQATHADLKTLDANVESLVQAARSNDRPRIDQAIQTIVPEYAPALQNEVIQKATRELVAE